MFWGEKCLTVRSTLLIHPDRLVGIILICFCALFYVPVCSLVFFEVFACFLVMNPKLFNFSSVSLVTFLSDVP